MRDHSQLAMSAITSTKSDQPTGEAKNSIARSTTRTTTAVMTRVRSKAI